jgi:hypothetical protein
MEAVYDDVPENIGLTNGLRASGTGSRTDVWRIREGRKEIWKATRTVRGRALRGAGNTTANYAQTITGADPILACATSKQQIVTWGCKRFQNAVNDHIGLEQGSS